MPVYQLPKDEAIVTFAQFKISVFIIWQSHAENANIRRFLIGVDDAFPPLVFFSCVLHIWISITPIMSFRKCHSIYNNILLVEFGGVKHHFVTRSNRRNRCLSKLVFWKGTAFAWNICICFRLENVWRCFSRRVSWFQSILYIFSKNQTFLSMNVYGSVNCTWFIYCVFLLLHFY